MADLDYGTLAQLTQPQMMPNAPMGAGAMAGMMYGQDRNRHEQALDGASSMAMLKAKMDAMKAEEYARGAPGRTADIDVNNAMAQGRLGNLPNSLDTQGVESRTKNLDARNKFIEETKQTLSQYASRWVKAKSDDEKNEILDEMEADGNGEFKGKKVRAMPRHLLDRMMEDVDATHPSPQQGKERIANISVEGKKAVANTAAQARIRAAEIAAQIAKYSSDNRLKGVIKDPLKETFQAIKDELGLTAAIQWYQEAANAKAAAGAANQPQRVDIDPNNTEQPVSVRPPAPVKGAALPAGMPTGKAPAGAVLKRMGKDGKIEYKLKDGSIVDEKGNPK